MIDDDSVCEYAAYRKRCCELRGFAISWNARRVDIAELATTAHLHDTSMLTRRCVMTVRWRWNGQWSFGDDARGKRSVACRVRHRGEATVAV